MADRRRLALVCEYIAAQERARVETRIEIAKAMERRAQSWAEAARKLNVSPSDVETGNGKKAREAGYLWARHLEASCGIDIAFPLFRDHVRKG